MSTEKRNQNNIVNFPGVKNQDCMKSIKLFRDKVMSLLKDDIDSQVKKVS